MRHDEPELCWWSAREVAAAIAARRLSAREYLTAQLDRIERYNPDLNLVVTIDERAFEWARHADEAVTLGRPLGPLHGVAVTVKDCLATAGLRTTGGEPALRSHVPRMDAVAPAGLRAAGAVIFGKTNLPSSSADVQTYNEVFGISRNPWHPGYTTGGSSGGGAGAVAAGFTPLELGSDVAGSIRLPAANCGVLGHKPSFGVVSTYGHVPPLPYKQFVPDLNVIGPIARCVDDLEIALTAIAGPHPADRSAWRIQLPAARPVRRVATWFDDPYCPVDEEVREALERAAAALAESGVTVQRAKPPGLRLSTSDEVFRRLLTDLAINGMPAQDLADVLAGRRPHDGGLGTEFIDQRHADWLRAGEQRQVLRGRWSRFFTQYDAILLPVAPNLAIEHDHRPYPQRRITVDGHPRPYWDQIVWAGLTGVCHLPSTVVPIGLDRRGLPIGVAVAADYLDDLTCLAAARHVLAAVPSLGRPTLPPVAL